MNLIYKFLFKGSLIVIISMLFSVHVYADETLWKSGKNLYIKIDAQDKSSQGPTEPNQHPVKLETGEITNALKAIKIYDKKKKSIHVFSIQQSTLLGKYLAKGFGLAEPNQDIVFALVKRSSSYAIVKETYYMGGRAFYADDRLNIIIGDYDKLPDKFLERVYSGTGDTQGVQYFFKHGKRAKKSNFKHRLLISEGITTKRRDWFVIDVEKASVAYIAVQNRNRKPTTQETVDAAIQKEVKKLAKERREMRLEMARMRKDIRESSNSSNSQLSIEERLVNLDELHKKNLISDSEYKIKRNEILNDI